MGNSLIWYETTCPRLEGHRFPEITLCLGCSSFWLWFCFIPFDLEDLIEIKMPPKQIEAAFWEGCFEHGPLGVGAILVSTSFCSLYYKLIVYFHSVFSERFSRVPSMKNCPHPTNLPVPALNISHTRMENFQCLETIMMTCSIPKMDHNSSCFFFVLRSSKCPNWSNHVSLRYSQLIPKVIAHGINVLSLLQNPLSHHLFSTPRSRALHVCTTCSAHICHCIHVILH